MSGLTKWEAGNELVKAADCLSAVAADLKDYKELQDEIIVLREKVSEIYNKNGFIEEMGFGI